MYEIVDNNGEGTFFNDSEVAWNVFDASPVGERLVKYAPDRESILGEWEIVGWGIRTLQGEVVDPDA
jgi:hypothetical protein